MSAYGNPSSGVAFTDAPLVHQAGGYLEFAAEVKAVCSIPVIAVGRVEPVLADQVIAVGEADFIAMGRKLLADAELPNKIAAGRVDDVRPCIYCYTCVSKIFVNDSVMCAVNAATGFEGSVILEPAEQCKKILVAGGGPAGMEAARVAALRGHQVVLCEMGKRLGGTVFFSSIVYEENGLLIDYLEKQITDLDVDIRLRTKADSQLIKSLGVDAVVLATGAKRDALPIPGADARHVFSGDALRQLMTGDGGAAVAGKLSWLGRSMMFFGRLLGITRDGGALRKLSHWWMPLGRRVAIVGGGLVGVELAEFLAERGRVVTIVEQGDKFGIELAIVRRWRVLHKLRELGVVMINNAEVQSITAAGLEIIYAGDSVVIDADSVILAAGASANSDLADELKSAGIDFLEAGDCAGVNYIEGAMHAGNKAGRAL
jgi:2,4-dienoyl-CoA reductase (NADPH2)